MNVPWDLGTSKHNGVRNFSLLFSPWLQENFGYVQHKVNMPVWLALQPYQHQRLQPVRGPDPRVV